MSIYNNHCHVMYFLLSTAMGTKNDRKPSTSPGQERNNDNDSCKEV